MERKGKGEERGGESKGRDGMKGKGGEKRGTKGEREKGSVMVVREMDDPVRSNKKNFKFMRVHALSMKFRCYDGIETSALLLFLKRNRLKHSKVREKVPAPLVRTLTVLLGWPSPRRV